MKSTTLLASLFLSGSSALASDFILAERAPVLNPRTSFQGGWPIAANTCPQNTTSCQQTGFCCPGSTSCYTDGLGGDAVCCPNTDSCYNTATAVPTCADPSWTLYIGNYDFFCCSTGQIGILPNKYSSNAGGLCVEAGTNAASSALATPYGKSGATAAPTAAATASGVASGVATATHGGGAGALVSSELGKITGAAPTATSKSNSAGKSVGRVSVVGAIIGFLLLPFGM